MMKVTEKSKSSYITHLAIEIDSQVTHHVVVMNKRVRGAPKGGLRTQETRLATALIKFRNKERNVKLPT